METQYRSRISRFLVVVNCVVLTRVADLLEDATQKTCAITHGRPVDPGRYNAAPYPYQLCPVPW